MKTIAVDDATWKKLKQLRDEKDMTFEELMEYMILKSEKVPKSMFGSAKGMKPISKKEHEEMWNEERR